MGRKIQKKKSVFSELAILETIVWKFVFIPP